MQAGPGVSHSSPSPSRCTFFHTTAGAIVVIVAVAWLLAVAHAVECSIWATAYLHLGAVENPADAMLYSIDSLTTRGTSGLVLQHHWLMMGAIESINGLLLFGSAPLSCSTSREVGYRT
jgi:hypothetical protein